ncbi:hypothetical protein PAI11_17930 [Patulibacter medicamentivorans]|uniref:Uncharacterized protein n=1 Tax=Patulibacter medicamentivorans TaxID=1097667 RepID=H0E4R2_9ACTN|nr:hypothetical protein PAI11_17930 [Patulibacter medicamentivorans]
MEGALRGLFSRVSTGLDGSRRVSGWLVFWSWWASARLSAGAGCGRSAGPCADVPSVAWSSVGGRLRGLPVERPHPALP